MKEIKECDLCGGSKFSFLFETRDLLHGVPGKFREVKCDNCGLIFVNPQPSMAELGKYYPSGKYYSLKDKKSNFFDGLTLLFNSKETSPFKKALFWPLKTITRSAEIVKNGRILDVGCGSGQFLVQAKKMGMKPSGVEPGGFDEKFAKSNKLNIYNGALKQAKFQNDYFDVITVNHALEHVNAPMETLVELKRILKPGGKLIIGVPNKDSLNYSLFKKYWTGLDSPRHLFTFSEKILRQYAEKTGLKLEKINYKAHPGEITGSLFFYAQSRSKKKTPINRSELANSKTLMLFFLPISILINLTRTSGNIEAILTKQPLNKQ